MTVHILYTHYYDRNGLELSVGGIQTYISSLADIIRNEGYSVVIYQSADIDFTKLLDGIKIVGIQCSLKESRRRLLEACSKELKSEDIVIFGTDSLTEKVNAVSVAIQHGVSWDVPDKKHSYFVTYIKKAYKAWKRVRQIEKADVLVCVDHNFINWIRAIAPYSSVKMVSIPNYTKIPEFSMEKDSSPIKIIFARRFFWYRGTRVFADAIKKVIIQFPEVEVTIAGDGDDGQWLHEQLDKYPNVFFTKYNSQESLNIHADKHIAVIPTVGSEGTSLSLLEAMATKCAVICTDVGGMTDIVIHNYNGLMIQAGNADELYNALVELITNENKRNTLAKRGYDTVSNAFSYDIWSNSWKRLLKSITVDTRNGKIINE